MKNEWQQVGTGDLRYNDDPIGGFVHVTIRDADDGDAIVVNESDLVALRDLLSDTINRHDLEPNKPDRYRLGYEAGRKAGFQSGHDNARDHGPWESMGR